MGQVGLRLEQVTAAGDHPRSQRPLGSGAADRRADRLRDVDPPGELDGARPPRRPRGRAAPAARGRAPERHPTGGARRLRRARSSAQSRCSPDRFPAARDLVDGVQVDSPTSAPGRSTRRPATPPRTSACTSPSTGCSSPATTCSGGSCCGSTAAIRPTRSPSTCARSTSSPGCGRGLALSGHGKPFLDVPGHIEGSRRAVRAQIDTALAALADGPRTALQVAERGQRRPAGGLEQRRMAAAADAVRAGAPGARGRVARESDGELEHWRVPGRLSPTGRRTTLTRSCQGSYCSALVRIDRIIEQAERPLFSFEFFPPQTDAGERVLGQALESLRQLSPDFVSVTYGAGGATRARTPELTKWIKNELGIEAMAHLTCVGASRDELRELLDEMTARRDRERARAARRPAARPGRLDAASPRAGVLDRAGRADPRGLRRLRRRRLLPRGPPPGPRLAHDLQLPQAEGRLRASRS